MKQITLILLCILIGACNLFEAIGEKSETHGQFNSKNRDNSFCYENWFEDDPTAFGTGGPADPYLIVSPYQLITLSQSSSLWTFDYKQICNISFQDISDSFTPIGTQANPFTGTYDGGYFVIHGLYIYEASAASYYGFFGYIQNSIIRRMAIVDASVDVSAGSYIAIAIGMADSSIVEEILVSGSVAGSHRVAGIMGATDNGGTYNNFINFSSVNALGSYIGGIVGSHGDTASANGLTQCVNYGEISSAGQNIGGVAGAIFNSSSIDECANLGPVNGDDSVGGIVGTVAATSTVSNTFSIGAITCTTCSNVGGAAGSIGTTGNLTAFSWINYGDDSAGNCYYDNQAALLSDVGCTTLTLASDFYGNSNIPMSTWDSTMWDFFTSDFPALSFGKYFQQP